MMLRILSIISTQSNCLTKCVFFENGHNFTTSCQKWRHMLFKDGKIILTNHITKYIHISFCRINTCLHLFPRFAYDISGKLWIPSIKGWNIGCPSFCMTMSFCNIKWGHQVTQYLSRGCFRSVARVRYAREIN